MEYIIGSRQSRLVTGEAANDGFCLDPGNG